MQTRDVAQVVSLPQLKNKTICPFRALKALSTMYPLCAYQSAFQIKTQAG